MRANGALQEIAAYGWTGGEFGLPETDRAEYARLANGVISAALEDEELREGLTFELNPGLEQGAVRTGLFGLGEARNSGDAKVYLHTGYDSQSKAAAVIPKRNQPALLREFWDVNSAMLAEVEESTLRMLGKIGADSLAAAIFPSDISRRNVHLRTVRYIDALNAPVGTEVVSGHADVGLMTWHLHETHGGWLHGASYAPALINAEDSPERRAAVRTMRAGMRLLDQADYEVPFFLGANLQTFTDVPMHLRNLPACYHAGFRPDAAAEEVSAHAGAITGGNADRVSVVTFLHPNGDELLAGTYVPATVAACRPKYQEG